jgi:hypothetical protein
MCRAGALWKLRFRACPRVLLLAGLGRTAGVQAPIVELRVEGNSHLPSEGVAAVFKWPAQGMRSVHQALNVRPGTDTINVVIGFQ